MGVTSCTDEIFNAFLSQDRMKTLFHGHSFTANPVACSASIASMDLMEKKETWKNIKRIGEKHKKFEKQVISQKSGVASKIKEIRRIGTILAIELQTQDETSYFNSIRDKSVKFFLDRGVLLRPLGNVIYLLPPYCISDKDLDYIYNSIFEFLKSL